ncbi:hypothetical protein BZG01_00210 [Labilibaculum manganireducens]|uniref:Phage tail protein n=1 Tax=Labilibaculum manganireducens TaxID=1940525 RepID=A0A2N3IGF6_9BACT|nr:phage tail tube protein [Labilibaculum manganireducens]PKQ69396.1 hypothetical protein BZG01_00210 [Labilibaculum manganireducens]
MAATGIIDGGDIIVAVESAVPGTFTPIAHSTSCKITTSSSFRERRTKDTNGKEKAFDETETTISVEALTIYGSYSYFDLKEKQLSGAVLNVKYAPKTEDTGDRYEEGLFFIESLERSDNVAEDSKVSVTFTQKEKPEVKTVA